MNALLEGMRTSGVIKDWRRVSERAPPLPPELEPAGNNNLLSDATTK